MIQFVPNGLPNSPQPLPATSRRIVPRISATLALFMLAGCATLPRPPEIVSAGIEPSSLRPGDTAILSVKVYDQYAIIDRIEGAVKEDDSITFSLRDDGTPPDAAAGDHIWTLAVEVPFNAPPGGFELELSAYDASGRVILIEDENGEAVPLSTRFTMTIEYAETSE